MKQVQDLHPYVQHCEKKVMSVVIEVNKVKPCFHDRKKSKEGKFTIHVKWNEKQALQLENININ